MPDVFDEEIHPLPGSEQLAVAGWPLRKDQIARAILAVALRHGGIDFADGRPASPDSLQTREYHHIFPDAWLQQQGYTKAGIYRSLNCAVVSWQTNRNISNKEPAKYIRERMEASSLGQSEVERRLQSHLIPLDSLFKNNYEDFLTERAELIHDAMIRLCDGTA